MQLRREHAHLHARDLHRVRRHRAGIGSSGAAIRPKTAVQAIVYGTLL
jgi:hypothetical protein